MSQRTGRRNRRHARQHCNSGNHRYGSPKEIGGGIVRRICDACAMVSIDLTNVTEPIETGALFITPRA